MRFVFKFGGSSLASVEKIQKVANYIKEIKSRPNTEIIVVVSAMGKTTNKLIHLADQLSTDNYSSEYSKLISCGENISAGALALALNEIDVDSISLSAKDIKIHAKGSPNNALITHIDKERIVSLLAQNKIVVVTGFQGVNSEDQTLTLGRGGSDTTAVALGVVFDATVKIFTDVNGFFAINPKFNPNAKRLKKINIYSALSASSFGAQVLDHRCLEIANRFNKKIEVVESLKNNGTKIVFNKNIDGFKIKTITNKTNLLLVKYEFTKINFLQHITSNPNFKIYFNILDKNKNKQNCCFLTNINKDQLFSLVLKKYQKQISLMNCESVVVCGSGLSFYPDIIKKVQNIIKIRHFYSYFINLQPTTLTIIVKKGQAQKLTNLLAKEFNLLNGE